MLIFTSCHCLFHIHFDCLIVHTCISSSSRTVLCSAFVGNWLFGTFIPQKSGNSFIHLFIQAGLSPTFINCPCFTLSETCPFFLCPLQFHPPVYSHACTQSLPLFLISWTLLWTCQPLLPLQYHHPLTFVFACCLSAYLGHFI